MRMLFSAFELDEQKLLLHYLQTLNSDMSKNTKSSCS